MEKEYREIINEVERKFYEVLETMTIDEIEEMAFCEYCPLKNVCGKEELYFGCGVWEESMGDDL